MARPWHSLTPAAAARELATDLAQGLSPDEADRRLAAHGKNALVASRRPSFLWLLAKQFQDFMVLVLAAAAAISFAMGEALDAAAVLAIVALNALLGAAQENRAERSLEALKRLAAPRARVVRGGAEILIPADQIVPGDLFVLEGGDRVSADCRLAFANAVAADESPLTGESVPVAKSADWTGPAQVPIGDRRNMLFMGTALVRGHARAVAVATGMQTEIGAIAALIHGAEEQITPLQRRLDQLGRWLVGGCMLTVAAVFAAGVWRGLPVYRMFLTGVSLAVAAIPEGLPAVVTIALAIGVQRMIRRKAIVRKLPAVETLGCATVICSDKTGTLTHNQMAVTDLELMAGSVSVSGAGQTTGEIKDGEFQRDGRPVRASDAPDLGWALRAAVLCNHASVRPPARDGKRLQAVGDPTEVALLVAGLKAGFDRTELLRQMPIVRELPFESERRRMSVVVQADDTAPLYFGPAPGTGPRRLALVKGAPDAVITRCSRALWPGEVRRLTEPEARRLLGRAEQLASRALRVLALACRDVGPASRDLPDPPPESLVENDLVFIGLVAMADPPRPEVKSAIARARRAGVRTVMVTGDHAATAAAIGRELGLCRSGAPVVTGDALERAESVDLRVLLDRSDVFARVSPRQKLLIVRALQEAGEVVAMTGDGVNDAPAVKEADIGIAMGETGTEVTKEAAAMVLADDNYATIVAAIEEGRGIYDNIRKFIRYLLACNAGEVLTMFVAAVSGLPLPLLPIQILWMNLVTDGLPAIALGVDPPGPGLMERPPRRPDEGVFAHRLHWKILWRGLSIGFCTIAAFFLALLADPENLPRARTLAFTTLVMSQLCYVFQCRSEARSVWELGIFSNPYLVGAVGLSAAMQLAVLYLPALQAVFGTVALSGAEWLLVAGFSGWSLAFDAAARAARARWRRRFSVLRVRA